MRRAPRGALLLVLLAGTPLATADEPPSSPALPYEDAFLPKAEIGVPAFLAAHPQADGRGVVVAVLDTGIDPGHPRLAKTSTGEPKILDLLDATDDGIVELPVVPTAAEVAEAVAVGATGRRLALGGHVRPGKKHRLGRIDAESVLPPDLAARVGATRREAHAAARRRARDAGERSAARPGESPADADARRAAEAAAADALPDETPAYDVLLVEQEGGWRAVIDTDADGDLGEERALADYATSHDWTTLLDDADLNVAVRPDADGARLRLLFDGDGHGTHVAGIVAGLEAPGHALNGVAPGARILGIKVGNSRWGGVTTNFAIARALDLAGARGAHVVNLSFGGPSFLGDAGTPDARVADHAVERFGLLCCFSAGNEGPAMSTVGSPATARRVLSVGAHVSPAKMRASYSLLGDDPGERLFGFSSRGPLPGGGLGVSVLAPGAAWSTLPSWRLVRGDNWNGTSMAAPQVAGACALLLSGARAQGVPADPARVARALAATARPVPGLQPFEQGAGLVQVDRAFDALVRMKGSPPERPLRATASNPTGVGGGVYERDAREPFDREVTVRVDWPESASAERIAYERRLVLSCDAAWATVPPRLGLNADGGSFTVRVDPSGLPEGVHATVVAGVDPARPADGPELVVPVTVVRPSATDAAGVFRAAVRAGPGERVARFFRVPVGASRLRVRAAQREGPKSVVTLAIGGLDQWRRPQDRVAGSRVTVGGGEEGALEASVMAGTVVEVVLFSHWGQNAQATFDVEARFLGPSSPDGQVVLGPGEDVALVRLSSLAAFSGRVSGKLTRTVERPSVCRTVEPDPRGPLFGDDRLFVARQTFSLRLGAGETVLVRPLGTSALDEVREDARWRVRDVAGRTVKKAVIDGPFELSGLPAGEYAVEYETPTWRRAPAECGTTGFEVLRPQAEAWATAYPTADLAADGTGASDRLDLPAGAARSVALRMPGLAEGALYVGEVEVKDDEGRVRLSLPLVVDRRVAAATQKPEDLQAQLVAAWRRVAEEAAGEPDLAPAARTAAFDAIARARRLADGPDLAHLEAWLRADEAEGAPARAAALERLAELERGLDRARDEDRPRLGAIHLARARVLRRDGRAEEAGKAFAEARSLLPASDPRLLAERVQRRRGESGDRRDALEAARALAAARPADFAAAARVVDVLLDLGWGVPAAAEVRAWPTRFPSRAAEAREAFPRVVKAGGDPAPRTLEALRAGAP
jgi:subtilisin family serine protease